MEKVKHRPPKIITDKEKIKKTKALFWKVFLIEGGLFLATLIAAFLCGLKLHPAKNFFQNFILSIIFVSFFIITFVVYKRAKKMKAFIYKGLFLAVVFAGGMSALNLIFPVFGSVVIMGILIWLWIKFSRVWMHNILILLGLAGIAGFFGLSFSPTIIVALLFIFSAYDFVAAYKTRHMALMAKELIESTAILGFVIPKNFAGFKDKIKKIKIRGDFMILGGSGVVFPGLLAVSVIPTSPLKGIVIILFSLIGCFFSYWLLSLQAEKHPMPELPPIALFSIIGYFIALFF